MVGLRIGFDAKRIYHNRSGLGNYSRDLVRILSSHFPHDQFYLYDKQATELGAPLSAADHVQFRPLQKGLLARQLLMGKQAQKDGCQVFHGLSGELPLRWLRTPIRKIVTIHDLIFLRYPKYYSQIDVSLHTWKFRRACHMADHVVAISEQTKQDIVHFFGTDPAKITVIYQGCQAIFKDPVENDKKAEIITKYQLPEKFFLSVGTIEERKNQLSTARAAIDTGLPVVFIGAKKSRYAKKLERLAIQNSGLIFLPENVSNAELAVLYQTCLATIYASLYEGFGIPVLESQFSGKIPILSNRSALPEAGGPNALYVDPTNVQDIGAKMKYLWTNSAASDLIMKDIDRHLAQFDEGCIAEQYRNVYAG